MCALPARHIVSSALCAALLVGITGPVAMAADPVRGHGHVAPDARLPGVDARLAQVEELSRGELTPVADLLNAALRDSDGRLPAAEARRLGAAAKAALAEVAAKGAETPATPAASTPATGVLPPAPALLTAEPRVQERRAADLVDDLLDAVLEAVDGLLGTVTSGVGDVLPSVDDLLTGVGDLIAALLGGDLLVQHTSSMSTSSDASSSTSSAVVQEPAAAAVTFPKITLLTPVLLPAS
ncbi:hypothetical protein [Streptomyces coeruleorubidus]|uniref:hypothetical protein n=1 Tax=Streptomyces coeruleorubidus TaxID=116188 RepID=UPI0033DFD46F